MNSIMRITAILAIVGSVGSPDYNDATTALVRSEHEVMTYAVLGVPHHLEPVYSRPLGELADCGVCTQGGCWSGRHSFEAGTPEAPDRAYGEGTHGCLTGFCSFAHPQTCDEGAMALTDVERQSIWTTATSGPPSSLANLSNALDEEVVTYNRARNALQVRGCGGVVILSVPLSSAQVAALDL